MELLVTLMALAIGMWWLFDRSRAGLSFSIFLTLLSSTITHSLLRYRLIRCVLLCPCPSSTFPYSDYAGSVFCTFSMIVYIQYDICGGALCSPALGKQLLLTFQLVAPVVFTLVQYIHSQQRLC